MAHRIGSHRKIKNEHKMLIIEEAVKLLNGALTLTREILAKLRRFAERKLQILIDDLALRRLIWGCQKQNRSDHIGPPVRISPRIAYA